MMAFSSEAFRCALGVPSYGRDLAETDSFFLKYIKYSIRTPTERNNSE